MIDDEEFGDRKVDIKTKGGGLGGKILVKGVTASQWVYGAMSEASAPSKSTSGKAKTSAGKTTNAM